MRFNQIEKARKAGKKIVLCGGAFDMIHPGHIFFLGQARRLGGFLVVVIARRKRFSNRKTVNSQENRVRVVSALKPVDMAIVGHRGDILDIVEEIRPHTIALGPDQPFREREMEKELGRRGLKVKVVRIKKRLRGHSTTGLLRKAGNLRGGPGLA